ncbi:hypothetical protein K438DRAFT_1957410 [Mycena galopus ATCC 62051]|nr:hypothetical protein K438DRAFT_1957410 [Mycena galopus ATCC 62051]
MSSALGGSSAPSKSNVNSATASVSAVDPGASADLAGQPPCAQTCLGAAANVTGCVSPLNITCVCTNADFQFKAESCLLLECQPIELSGAILVQYGLCGATTATVSPTATAPFTPPNPNADISSTSSVSASAASGASGSASTSGNTGAAIALFAPNSGKALILAMGVALFGGAVGGFIV